MKTESLPNIIIILCDTLGAKHMSLYGYHRNTTPRLDKLVKKYNFTIYDNCFAPAQWTPPSHASLFTGQYPKVHKVDRIDTNFLHHKFQFLYMVMEIDILLHFWLQQRFSFVQFLLPRP